MKVPKNIWQERMDNLIQRRKAGKKRPVNALSDYSSHLSKVHVGNSVLDVGCGSMTISLLLPKEKRYFGLDPFPTSPEVIEGIIEADGIEEQFSEIDTVLCFAVMDGCMDFHKACENIKKIAKTNVVFLTGIGIEVDKFHTLKLQLEDYRIAFSGWKETLCDQLTEKIYLLEYTK